jgi:hypothetical protein
MRHTHDRSFGGVYPERAGPNGADRVLGDKGRRVMEIFLEYARLFGFGFV